MEAEVDSKGDGRCEGIFVEDGENAPGANLATVAFAHFLNDLDVSLMFCPRQRAL